MTTPRRRTREPGPVIPEVSDTDYESWEFYRQILPKETLLKVLKREDELWRSQETQDAFSVSYDSDYHTQIIEDNQRKALAENGVTDLVNGLIALHTTRMIYSRDKEFLAQMKEIAMYMKYDISGDCDLQVGDTIPECQLFYLDGSETSLHEQMDSTRPLVIVGGSYS